MKSMYNVMQYVATYAYCAGKLPNDLSQIQVPTYICTMTTTMAKLYGDHALYINPLKISCGF